MTIAQLIEACGDDVTFQVLNRCLHGNQKLTKHGTQITFIAPGIDLVDLMRNEPNRMGFVVWLPGEKVREIQKSLE